MLFLSNSANFSKLFSLLVAGFDLNIWFTQTSEHRCQRSLGFYIGFRAQVKLSQINIC